MKKEICFTIPSEDNKSGIVKVVVSLVNLLSMSNKYKITLLSMSNKSMDILPLKDDINIIRMPLKNKTNKISRLVDLTVCLLDLFRKYVPDILVVSGTEFVLPVSMAMKKKIRLVVWEHRNFYACPRFRLEWLGKRYALKRWNNVLCITKKDAVQYADYAGDAHKIIQIYNMNSVNIIRGEYNINSKKIVSCGYLDPIKGFDMLMLVAKKIFDKHNDWTWDIYGEGPERENLKYLIDSYGLSKNVFLKGYCENIKDIYKDYSFFVFTSRAEGLGMVMVEALKAGLPVISFDIPCGPSDIIRDNINGFLVRPFDLSDMADKIIYLINNKDIRRKFSLKSDCYLSEFNSNIIMKKWNDFFMDKIKE